MSGRFINTDRTGVLTQSTISSTAVDYVKQILNNPYYLFSDKKASKCIYYNLNTTMTTLDEATRGNYGEISPDSPLRFNRIANFLIYGVGKIEPNLDLNDYGLEGQEISNEAIVLPYTIVPYPGDFFILDSLGKKYLFKVIEVNPNTLDTGVVMYKINYVLSSSDGIEDIEPQVVRRLNFVISNLGSNFASLIEEDIYNTASDMENMSTRLKNYFISLFYDDRIQSFSYKYDEDTFGGCAPNPYGYCEFMGFKVYDSYLIEFLIRNEILSGADRFIHVAHQMYLDQTFPVDYDRTIFRSIETGSIKSHIGTYTGNLYKCTQELSLLYAYPFDYYYMEYRRLNPMLFNINIFDDMEFDKSIRENDCTSRDPMETVLIKSMNSEDITAEDLERLEHIDYMPNRHLFYMIPITIFCLDKYIQSMLAKETSL
jgi:hypothetical protein